MNQKILPLFSSMHLAFWALGFVVEPCLTGVCHVIQGVELASIALAMNMNIMMNIDRTFKSRPGPTRLVRAQAI